MQTDRFSTWTASDDEDEAYSEHKARCIKRRKTNTGRGVAQYRVTRASASISGLLDVFKYGMYPGETAEGEGEGGGEGYESTIEGLLPEYLEARKVAWSRTSETADSGEHLRPLSRFETTRVLEYAKQRGGQIISLSELVVLRKLQVQRERHRVGFKDTSVIPATIGPTLAPLDVPPSAPLPQGVLDSLKATQTTHYENSFAARIYGHKPQQPSGLIATDWESRSTWTNLMEDIHEHYSYAYPERDQMDRSTIPITYVCLQPSHLRQVHDLLARVFWDGVDVSDSLQYSPERCTVIAMYGHLVVGAAFLSSPQETYITYLAVRAGWDNSQIATTMLYHLISLNPYRDITLHVSANNPAMLLYNRFGFKAEEFIAGFYEEYMDAQSKASKNAFRLRLRR